MNDLKPVLSVEEQFTDLISDFEKHLKSDFGLWKIGNKYALKYKDKTILKFNEKTLIAKFAGEEFNLSKEMDVCRLLNRMDTAINYREQLDSELKDLESVTFENDTIKDRIERIKRLLK